MTKKQLALEVIERLKKEYPLADCTLDYDAGSYEVLVGSASDDIRLRKVIQIEK